MRRYYGFTIALLLMAFSFTLQAGVIDIYGKAWTGIGDAAVQGTYTGFTNQEYTSLPGALTQTVVGGNLEDVTPSLAVPVDGVGGLEDQLRLATGQLSGLGAVNGSAIYYSNVSVREGDILCIAINFVANDDIPFDDFAFFSASSGSGDDRFSIVEMLARIDESQPGGVGGFASSGYHTFSYKFAEEGSYTLGFGVVNVGDGTGDSALLLDSAPEPSSWLLAGSAILGVFLLRRRGIARAR